MKSRETLIRLKKFQVDEKRRRVAQIEAMVADFERMANDLDREVANEERRALFFAPLAGSIPAFATAPALIYVACLMARGMTEIDWEDASEYAPAVLTALTMPFTFSIADGIAVGFISYAAIKIASGRFSELSPVIAVLAALFVAKYAFI